MTIGIGALATSEIGRQRNLIPDTAILIADTMGSYGDVDSHSRLHKVFMFPEVSLYAAVADQVDRAAELLVVLTKILEAIPNPERNYGSIVRALATACYLYKRDKFTIHQFPKLRLPPKEIDPQTASPELNATVQTEWEKFSIGCDLIIVAFDCDGRACLFEVDGPEHEIRNMYFPGFSAIGSGCTNALFWLSRRQHTLGLLPLRAGYHAYEAKLMAEASPHVNEHLDILVATRDEHWFSTTHSSLHTEKPHPEINMKTLKRLWKRYSPRDTSELGAEKSPTH